MFPLSSSDQLGYIPGERLHWAEMQRDTIIHDRRHLIRTLVEGVFPFDDRGFWTRDLQACGGWAAFHLVAVELNVLSHVDGVLHSITARATYLFSRGRRLLLHNRIAHLFSCGNVFYSITATDAYLFSLEDVFCSITERAAYLFSCGRCLPLHNRKLHICFHVEEVFHFTTTGIEGIICRLVDDVFHFMMAENECIIGRLEEEDFFTVCWQALNV